MAIAPGEKEATRKLAQEVGARSVAQLEAGLARISGETGPNSRWLLGALVLLNGGGLALAASQGGWLAPKAMDAAISFFVIGAALAVLAALGGTLAALLLSRQIGEAIALWTQVAASAEIGDGALKAAAGVRRTGLLAALGTLGIALLSLILFVAGALTLASGFSPAAGTVPETPVNAPVPANVAAPTAPKPSLVATPTPVEAAKPVPAPEPKAAPAPEAKPTPPPPRRRPTRQAQPSAPAEAPAATPPAAVTPPAGN